MQLDDLQLSAYTIQNLYPKTLIKTTKEPISNQSVTPVLKYLGANQKRVVIAVKNNAYPFVDDNELAFLTKVIGACKLTLADVAIINIANIKSMELLKDLKTILTPSKLVMFGVDSLELTLPFQMPDFQVQQFDGTQYLTAPALSMIEKDQQLKKQLWNCFQKMFL